MTPQEQQLLQDLCARLTLTQGQPKDAQADAELHRSLSAAPDALYWLAQRTLMLEQAMQQAQQQIGDLQQQLAQARQSQSQGGSSFLSGGLSTHFGRAPEPAAAAGSVTGGQAGPINPGPFQPAVQPSSWRDRFSGGATPRSASASGYSQPAAATGAGAGSSFLGNAAAAAAGVAGGMFLFNGLGGLMGGHHASSSGDAQAQAEGSSAQNLHADSGGTSSLANDAGLGSIDGAASFDNESWDDGGGFFGDDFG